MILFQKGEKSHMESPEKEIPAGRKHRGETGCLSPTKHPTKTYQLLQSTVCHGDAGTGGGKPPLPPQKSENNYNWLSLSKKLLYKAAVNP